MFYHKHVFVCTNVKEDGRKSCGGSHADETAAYLSQRLKEENAWGPGKIRVTKTKCLGRCAEGPCTVVYPEGEWYRLLSPRDVDEWVQVFLKEGESVEKLQILEKK
jgi:(2Fe-2S) ferredoxin